MWAVGLPGTTCYSRPDLGRRSSESIRWGGWSRERVRMSSGNRHWAY